MHRIFCTWFGSFIHNFYVGWVGWLICEQYGARQVNYYWQQSKRYFSIDAVSGPGHVTAVCRCYIRWFTRERADGRKASGVLYRNVNQLLSSDCAKLGASLHNIFIVRHNRCYIAYLAVMWHEWAYKTLR